MLYDKNPPWSGEFNGLFRYEMHEYIVNETNFVGISPGVVKFDSTGDRQTPHKVVFFQNATAIKSATYDPLTNQWTANYTPIIWADGTTNPPPDIPPFSIYTINPVLQIIFMTFACAAMVIVFIFLFMTCFFWKHSRIQASTPTFMFLIILSALLSLSIVLVIGVFPTNATCIIPHWFGHVAFYLTFSCLFFKTARVWYFFYTDITKEVINISNLQLLSATGKKHFFLSNFFFSCSGCWGYDLPCVFYCFRSSSPSFKSISYKSNSLYSTM